MRHFAAAVPLWFGTRQLDPVTLRYAAKGV